MIIEILEEDNGTIHLIAKLENGNVDIITGIIKISNCLILHDLHVGYLGKGRSSLTELRNSFFLPKKRFFTKSVWFLV